MAEGWSTYQVNNDSLDLFDIFEAPLWHQISKKKLFHNGCWFFIITLTSRKGTNKDRRQLLFLAIIKWARPHEYLAIRIYGRDLALRSVTGQSPGSRPGPDMFVFRDASSEDGDNFGQVSSYSYHLTKPFMAFFVFTFSMWLWYDQRLGGGGLEPIPKTSFRSLVRWSTRLRYTTWYCGLCKLFYL